MNDNELYDKIKKQIEYYLSDENLKDDKFFNSTIRDSVEGYIPLQIFLNCNKIKKMNINIEKLQKSIETSDKLLLSTDKSKVKRNSSVLPELRSKELLLTLDNNKQHSNPDLIVVFVPYVITFQITPEIFFKARDFEKKVSKLFLMEVPYVKISKKLGVVVFNQKVVDLEAIQDLLDKEIVIEKENIIFQKLSLEDTSKWFKNNRPYLENALKMKYDYSIFRDNNDLAPQEEIDDNFGPVDLKIRSFKDFRDLKSFLKGLISRTRNNDLLEDNDCQILKVVLNSHVKAAEKLALFKGVTVNANPQYPSTRCFFIVRTDGSSEDFSYHKCLSNMYNTLIHNK